MDKSFRSPSGQSSPPNNNLLKLLRREDYRLIAPHLDLQSALNGHLLYRPGENVDVVYFPCGPTLTSYLVSNADGQSVETILVGREGAIGGIVSLGRLPAYCRITVKYGGDMMRLPVAKLEAAKLTSPPLRHLFARYADCLMAQIFQSTACNAVHSIEQRAAKWILSAMDRTGTHEVPLTHEELATMLGVGRSYTSRILQQLKSEGILDTRRGALLVRNQTAMIARACGCNDLVKDHFDIVLRGAYPDDDR